MKRYIVSMCIFLAVLLTSCNSALPQETGGDGTAPTTGAQSTGPAATHPTNQETPDPTEDPSTPATLPQPTEPVADPDVELFQELLGASFSWYNMALTSTYESAADLDLSAFFYNGFKDESQKATDAEAAYLNGVMGTDWAHMDLVRLPADKMDGVLQQYFGINLADMKGVGLDALTYWEETNAYYCAHTDASDATIQVTKVLRLDNGEIQVFYHRDYPEGDMIVTLKSVGTDYQILSNRPDK